MGLSAIRMGLAVRQNDALIRKRLPEYPGVLPLTHPAALAEWQPRLRWKNGVLTCFSADEFRELSPLSRQLEVVRCHAEARLALVRTGALNLAADDEEWLFQRAVGISPGYEDQRFLELAGCRELAPDYMASDPERFLAGIALVEQELGPATAFGYGFLLLAGVRTREDLVKYGRRLEDVFARVVGRPAVANLVEAGGTGLRRLRGGKRVQLLYQVLSALWQEPKNRAGATFLLTQVVDGFLGLRPGGVGTDFGLCILDTIILSKLGFRVTVLERDGYHCLSVATPGGEAEFWDPLDPDARAPAGKTRRLTTAEVFIEGYVLLARGYVSTRAYAHVERVARWLQKMKPDLNEVYELLGVGSLGLGRPNEALEYCTRALNANPRLPETWLVQGNACAVLSRWPEAIASYRKAIAYRVGYAEAYNNLGLVLDRNGEPDRAAGAFEEALRINPGYVEALYNLGNLLLGQERHEPAVEAYRKAVEFRPAFAGAHYNMGQAFYRMGRKREAVEAYLAAVEANPKHAGAWHNLGIVYRDLGESERAVEAIERAVSLNPMLLR